MPRLKMKKLQRLEAWICHHPKDSLLGEPDEYGRQRCGRCGYRITTVLTRKGLDAALDSLQRRD